MSQQPRQSAMRFEAAVAKVSAGCHAVSPFIDAILERKRESWDRAADLYAIANPDFKPTPDGGSSAPVLPVQEALRVAKGIVAAGLCWIVQEAERAWADLGFEGDIASYDPGEILEDDPSDSSEDSDAP